MDVAEKSLRAAAVAGVIAYGPSCTTQERAQTASEGAGRKRGFRIYACNEIRMSNDAKENSTTAKETAIVEEKVATAEGSMTIRIMFTEVMVAGEKKMNPQPQPIITRLVSNDSTGFLEPKQKAQDIRKENVKRAAMQERRRGENGAQVLRCNREELKVWTFRERRNRESIAEVIKHQRTPEVDSEASSTGQLKRRALEERRMREHDKRNLAGAPLLQRNNIDAQNIRLQEKQQQSKDDVVKVQKAPAATDTEEVSVKIDNEHPPSVLESIITNSEALWTKLTKTVERTEEAESALRAEATVKIFGAEPGMTETVVYDIAAGISECPPKAVAVVTQQETAQGQNKQQLDRADAWNKKVGRGIELCACPPSLTDARDTIPPADDDAASAKAATLDDVTSADIGVGVEHIDADERAAPMGSCQRS